MKEASRYGLSASNIPEGPLRNYVASKGNNKRVKFYKGYIFIFAKTSTSCITMYPVDEEVLKVQEMVDKK